VLSPLELLLTQLLLLLLMLSMDTGGASSAVPAANALSVALFATVTAEVAAALFLASAKRIDLNGGEVEILRYFSLSCLISTGRC
jgi:hypothetical protein